MRPRRSRPLWRSGPPALAILAAIVIVYVALVIRKVLIVVTAVFASLAFAGSLADITVAWTRRWIEFTLALIFSKLVFVLIFVIGYFMLIKGAGQVGTGVTQEVTQVVSGVIVLALAGFAPWMALKVVHFTGDHAGQLHAMSANTAGAALAAGRMGQKAMPSMGTVTRKLSAGSGNNSSSGDTAGPAEPSAQRTPSGPAGTPGSGGDQGGPSPDGSASPSPESGEPPGSRGGPGPSGSGGPSSPTTAPAGPGPGPAAGAPGAPAAASAGASAGAGARLQLRWGLRYGSERSPSGHDWDHDVSDDEGGIAGADGELRVHLAPVSLAELPSGLELSDGRAALFVAASVRLPVNLSAAGSVR